MQRQAEGRAGERIRAQRIRKGLTQIKLADLSTVGVRTIRELEAGRTLRPHPVTLRLLMSALGIPDDDHAVTAHSWESGTGQGDAADDLKPLSPLPATYGDFIGRADDLALLTGVLVQGQRLVTVTGFPGSGKSRLAIEVAGAVQKSTGIRVVLVPGDGEPVAAMHASASARSATGGHREAVLNSLSLGEPVLLVIDGAQRGVWPAGIPRPPHPSFQVLATSRRSLGLPGEIVHSLSPLAVPAPATQGTDACPAVQLLIQFIRRFQPDFRRTALTDHSLAELCRRLDSNPALLQGIAEDFSIFEAESLVGYVTADLVSAVAEAAPAVLAGAREVLAGLDAAETELLLQVSGLTPDWSVDDVANLLNEPPLRVGRRVRSLLDAGVVQPRAASGAPRFQVLRLVRAMTGGMATAPLSPSAGHA
ncbi:helix-turn-helix domain-containing protein [Streptomyces sp. NBC_00209]|uniref:helix-turn-helix domain-containing protein n=1 Tax=Streptomyces sp. NBC_00209 TaxID=2975682 RepID=UPI003245AB7A